MIPGGCLCAFSLNSIENLNGMVGGVTVEIQQDFDDFKAGDTVTLNNEQAYHFIRVAGLRGGLQCTIPPAETEAVSGCIY